MLNAEEIMQQLEMPKVEMEAPSATMENGVTDAESAMPEPGAIASPETDPMKVLQEEAE